MKKIIMVIMVLALVAFAGCEEISSLTQGGTQTSTTSPKIVKAVELGGRWAMKQMSFKVEPKSEVSILLKLADGDKVDGYFYLEKGERLDFKITGKTLLYQSGVPDRFSFAANQDQGDTYTLTFRNSASDDDRPTAVIVFLEVIYPLKGSIYIPVESK